MVAFYYVKILIHKYFHSHYDKCDGGEDMDWETTIANGLFVVLGAGIGGFATIFSSNRTIKKQNEESIKKEEEFAAAVVEKFLYDEINYNLLWIINNAKPLYNALIERKGGGVVNPNYSFNSSELRNDEYQKVKYDLVKYKTDEIKHIFNLYRYIDICQGGKSINELNAKDADTFGLAIQELLKKFK